mgnify:CR=1 FL=1
MDVFRYFFSVGNERLQQFFVYAFSFSCAFFPIWFVFLSVWLRVSLERAMNTNSNNEMQVAALEGKTWLIRTNNKVIHCLQFLQLNLFVLFFCHAPFEEHLKNCSLFLFFWMIFNVLFCHDYSKFSLLNPVFNTVLVFT